MSGPLRCCHASQRQATAAQRSAESIAVHLHEGTGATEQGGSIIYFRFRSSSSIMDWGILAGPGLLLSCNFLRRLAQVISKCPSRHSCSPQIKAQPSSLQLLLTPSQHLLLELVTHSMWYWWLPYLCMTCRHMYTYMYMYMYTIYAWAVHGESTHLVFVPSREKNEKRIC